MNKKCRYINLLNRIQKRFYYYEGLLILKKQFFTDNTFYYISCIIVRFTHIISFCGDYYSIYMSNITLFKKYLKIFSCYNIFEHIQISSTTYIIVDLILLILFFIRIIIALNILNKLNNYKNINKIYLKQYIILDHIKFLLFPYIMEYMSFIYYIFFFKDKFFINSASLSKIIIFVCILINTILIILYNIENYINIICSNKRFITTIFEVYKSIKEKKIINSKPIAYKCSNFIIYILVFLENFVLISNIEKYLNIFSKIILKIIISTFLLISIFVLLIYRINKFNYKNIINSFFNIIILFCYYSIILDFIMFCSKIRLTDELNEIIYIIIKLILSYITNLLLTAKTEAFLESKIREILFQETNIIKEKYFINCFYYLYEILLKIKEEKDIKKACIIINIIGQHIKKCNKINCNCRLFEVFFKNKNDKELNKTELNNYLNIVNYLFEYTFIGYDFYSNYDLSILLAEYFCHLKKNPTMAFSLIITFMIKQTNKFNKYQLVILYELCQKYIYYISAKVMIEKEEIFKNNNYELLLEKNREEELKGYYIILKISYKVKNAIINYIVNELRI